MDATIAVSGLTKTLRSITAAAAQATRVAQRCHFAMLDEGEVACVVERSWEVEREDFIRRLERGIDPSDGLR